MWHAFASCHQWYPAVVRLVDEADALHQRTEQLEQQHGRNLQENAECSSWCCHKQVAAADAIDSHMRLRGAPHLCLRMSTATCSGAVPVAGSLGESCGQYAAFGRCPCVWLCAGSQGLVCTLHCVLVKARAASSRYWTLPSVMCGAKAGVTARRMEAPCQTTMSLTLSVTISTASVTWQGNLDGILWGSDKASPARPPRPRQSRSNTRRPHQHCAILQERLRLDGLPVETESQSGSRCAWPPSPSAFAHRSPSTVREQHSPHL